MTATTIPAAPAVPAPVRVDLGLYPEIQRFGAADISACFSCGTCSATCPMSQTDGTFPRRIIRYAQLGMKDALLGSKELWTCYQCGECAETCPTQADPSEFMAATRRYAIASYDRTRLARTMYTRPIVATILAVLIAAFFAAFMYTAHGPMSGESLAIFEFIPAEIIHGIGIVVMILVVLAGLLGVGTMARDIGRREGVSVRSALGSRAGARPNRARAVVRDRARIHRPGPVPRGVRGRCRRFHRALVPAPLARPRAGRVGLPRPAGGHRAGLRPGACSASRRRVRRCRSGTRCGCSGTVAGAALVYGATILIIDRYRAANRSVVKSTTADWLLLALLWVTAVTGFAIELALYLPERPGLGLLAVPRPRRGRDGARAPRPVHEARPRGVPAGRAVLRGTGRPAEGGGSVVHEAIAATSLHHRRTQPAGDRRPTRSQTDDPVPAPGGPRAPRAHPRARRPDAGDGGRPADRSGGRDPRIR